LKTKTCSVCSATKTGHVWYAGPKCYACYTREHRKRNPEYYRKYDRDRRRANPELYYERDRRRHAKNRDRNNARSRAYRQRHLEHLRQYDSNRWATDPDRRKAHTDYRANNLERVREYDRQEYRRNKAAHIARVNGRRAVSLLATPKWLSEEQKQQLASIYANRPEGHHVDHIVPLQGKDVCGLHVPWNLQYLPATENLRKSNKLCS
jgi:hypothetical protein